MKRIGLFKFCLIFSIVSFCYALSIQASDDSEYWATTKFSLKVNERIKLNLIEQFRLKHDMGNFYTYVQYVGPSFKITDWFDAAVWYKLVSSKKNQDWSESHRFDIDGTLKWNFNGFKFSDRSRFERNTTKSSWLYRNKIKLAKKIKLFNRDFTPFISNEFFLDLEPHSGYHENRGSIGVSTGFVWESKLSIYYMSRLKKKHGDWINANILGTTIGFSF